MQQCCVHSPGQYKIQKLHESMETEPPTGSTKPSSGALGGRIWGSNKITWKIITDTPTIPGKEIEVQIFKRVFTQLGLYIPQKIVQLNKPTADADIRIYFSKDDPYWVQFPSALAYGWGPGAGQGGDITFNSKNYIWAPDGKSVRADKAYELGWITSFVKPDNKLKTWNAQHTGTHEGQHSLGCRHIPKETCPGAVINPIYNGGLLIKQCEIDQLQGFYGKPNLTKTQIDQAIKEYLTPIPY